MIWHSFICILAKVVHNVVCGLNITCSAFNYCWWVHHWLLFHYLVGAAYVSEKYGGSFVKGVNQNLPW